MDLSEYITGPTKETQEDVRNSRGRRIDLGDGVDWRFVPDRRVLVPLTDGRDLHMIPGDVLHVVPRIGLTHA